MRFEKATVGGTVEILASKDFQAIPARLAGTDPVKAGMPINGAGAAVPAGTGAAGILLYDTDPNENPNCALVVSGTSRLQIAIYDKMYKDESGIAHDFVPDGYVCLVRDGSLGNTWYGTTPEEADLMSDSGAEVSIVNTGVAVTRIIDTHPVNVNTFASEIVLPSYERMDEVAVIQVMDEAAQTAAVQAGEAPVQKSRSK